MVMGKPVIDEKILQEQRVVHPSMKQWRMILDVNISLEDGARIMHFVDQCIRSGRASSNSTRRFEEKSLIDEEIQAYSMKQKEDAIDALELPK